MMRDIRRAMKNCMEQMITCRVGSERGGVISILFLWSRRKCDIIFFFCINRLIQCIDRKRQVYGKPKKYNFQVNKYQSCMQFENQNLKFYVSIIFKRFVVLRISLLIYSLYVFFRDTVNGLFLKCIFLFSLVLRFKFFFLE